MEVPRPKERWAHQRVEQRSRRRLTFAHQSQQQQLTAGQQIEAVVEGEEQPQDEGGEQQEQEQKEGQVEEEQKERSQQQPSPVPPSQQEEVACAAECGNGDRLFKPDGQAQSLVSEHNPRNIKITDDLKAGTANQPQPHERSEAALPAGWGMRQHPSGRQHYINLHTHECFAASRYLMPDKKACHKAKESRPPLRVPIKASPRFVRVAGHREAKQKRRAQIYAVNTLLRKRRQQRRAGAV